MEQRKMFCEQCGSQILPGHERCTNCGWEENDQDSESSQSPHPQPYPQPPPIPDAHPPLQILGTLLALYPPVKRPGMFSFLYRIHCPFCNKKFHPSDCAIYSERYDNQGKHILLEFAPQDALQRFVSRFYIKPLDGEHYTMHNARRECPQCKKLLPRNFEVDPNFTIAVIGDVASGKSHYITTLLHQLKEGELVQQGGIRARLTPLTEEVNVAFKKYEQTVFGERKALPATRPHIQSPGDIFDTQEPLIFRLEIGGVINGQFRNNMMNLIFYDLAGEDITQEHHLRSSGWPILQAQSIINIIDPLSIPNILSRLPLGPQVERAQMLLSKRPKAHNVLADVIRVYIEYHRGDRQHAVNAPVAIMLSKSDVLTSIEQQISQLPLHLLQNPTYDGSIDFADIDQIDKEVRYLLSTFGEQELLRESQRFTNIRFFATSATGCAPNEYNAFQEIKPRRCLDPLLWLLWKFATTMSQ